MSYSAYAGLSGAWTAPAAHGAVINLNERLRLNIAAFPSLDLNSGSAIITFNSEVTTILINRESETDFHALDPTCTHAGCRVNPYSIATNTIACPCHGSQFSMQGQVIQGPAVGNLQPYATQFEAPSFLNIEVPGLIHRLDQIAVHSSSRMRLTFPTMFGSQYHIRHSPDLTAPFEIISFATTAEGVATESVLNGTGEEAIVFVDTAGAAGFFVLELLVYQVA
ncbi:MAG: Rieske (2Fe-2S) protein [Prosthecobacter sp.]|nr:Rieske (2Fe-2S) protein [Prosthecobacter sp.]